MVFGRQEEIICESKRDAAVSNRRRERKGMEIRGGREEDAHGAVAVVQS